VRTSTVIIAVVAVGANAACRGRDAAERAPGAARSAARIDPPAIAAGDARATLRALRAPQRVVAKLLGAHRLQASSRLRSQVPSAPEREVKLELDLRIDAHGRFAAVKNTHPQHGQEVVWDGKHLYPRLRWSKFVRRPAEPGEPAEIVDRMAGLLPAYVELLRRFTKLVPDGRVSYLGRDALRVALALEPSPPPPPALPPARAWRRTMAVSSLEGKAVIDARSGAPLAVELRASWRFSPPAAVPQRSGIPEKLDPSASGTMELRFEQRVSQIGAVAAIATPPAAEVIDNPRRIRLEIERQMLSGELPIGDDRGALP
jgi:hypothetical protein